MAGPERSLNGQSEMILRLRADSRWSASSSLNSLHNSAITSNVAEPFGLTVDTRRESLRLAYVEWTPLLNGLYIETAGTFWYL